MIAMMIATTTIEPRMPNPIIKSFVPTSLLFQSMTQSSSSRMRSLMKSSEGVFSVIRSKPHVS
jgi:hypothetical protein